MLMKKRKEVRENDSKGESGLITGDGRTCLQDQAVYLDKEGKIGWIGDAAEAAGRYPEEMVKDYGEATILPGLFDMHVHFGYYYSQPDLFR